MSTERYHGTRNQKVFSRSLTMKIELTKISYVVNATVNFYVGYHNENISSTSFVDNYLTQDGSKKHSCLP